MAAADSTIDWSASYVGLRAFVTSRVREAADAEDLVHLALERAIAKAPAKDVENVTAWLYAIARNAIADYYRERARLSLAAVEALEAESPPVEVSQTERTYVLACMEPLLGALSSDDATILRWADMQGRGMQAIADELGITLTAAKSRVQRARKEFVKVTRACCAIARDARGRVTSMIPHTKTADFECACTSTATTSQKGSS